MYVAGHFNDWEPRDPAYKIEDDGDGTYSLKFPPEAGTWHLRIHRAFWEETIGNAGEDYCFTMPVDVTVHFDGITITVDVPEAVAEETCTPYEDYVPDEEEHRRDGEEKEQEETTSAVFWITDGMVGGAEKIYCSERV